MRQWSSAPPGRAETLGWASSRSQRLSGNWWRWPPSQSGPRSRLLPPRATGLTTSPPRRNGSTHWDTPAGETPVPRPARYAGLPSPARLLRPRRIPAPAGPARPAHRHPRHPLRRRRRHRAPAPGGPDPADGLVLLRRTVPAHRRIPRARRMARGIRDRRPRPPLRPPATGCPHRGSGPVERVVPPGGHAGGQG